MDSYILLLLFYLILNSNCDLRMVAATKVCASVPQKFELSLRAGQPNRRIQTLSGKRASSVTKAQHKDATFHQLIIRPSKQDLAGCPLESYRLYIGSQATCTAALFRARRRTGAITRVDLYK